jgi:hypothetical protein
VILQHEHPNCVTGARSHTKAIGGESLATKLVGAQIEGYGFHGSWVYPFFKSDSNLTCTLVLDILMMILEVKGGLPPILFLQMDNCGRENKNHIAIGFLAVLIELKIFKEIYLNFLPVGHTHCKVDQRFSRISVHLKPQDLPTLDHMIDSVKGMAPLRYYHLLSYNKVASAELTFGNTEVATHETVRRVSDWISWFGLQLSGGDESRIVHQFHGLGTCKRDGLKRRIHSFKICLDSTLTYSVLKYKEWDQSTPWRSHWGGASSQDMRILKEGRLSQFKILFKTS